MAHVLLLQAAAPFVGTAHAVQPAAVQPDVTLLLSTQVVGSDAGQPWVLFAHVTLQVVPLQTDAPLATGTHAVQPAALQPDATLLLATQVPPAGAPHRWKPALHARTQAPAVLQLTVPFAGALHTAQLLPHDVRLVLPLTTQAAAAPVPHA